MAHLIQHSHRLPFDKVRGATRAVCLNDDVDGGVNTLLQQRNSTFMLVTELKRVDEAPRDGLVLAIGAGSGG